MNKTNIDMLWSAGQNGSSTPPPTEPGEDTDSSSSSLSADYDYEHDGDQGSANETGWENDDKVEDPSHLDYMTWPPFLPGRFSKVRTNNERIYSQ